jgi:hypothetical protein
VPESVQDIVEAMDELRSSIGSSSEALGEAAALLSDMSGDEDMDGMQAMQAVTAALQASRQIGEAAREYADLARNKRDIESE